MELGKYIFKDLEKNPYLISLYAYLIKKYASELFYHKDIINAEPINIDDLLRFADLLSKSTDEQKYQKHNNIAQNIVVLLRSLYPKNENVIRVYYSVLNHIRNYKGAVDDIYFINDLREFVSDYMEKELYRYEFKENAGYFVRDQKQIFNTIKQQKFYSYSGPTSMGKTFVIRRFIVSQIAENERKNFVIVVPTKALISEITSDFINELGEDLKNKKYKVVNTPNELDLDNDYNYVMVYTQERLLCHLINSNVEIDYVFIDEAHQLFNNDSRSTLIFKILDILKNKDIIPNIYFSAPLIKNPNTFLNMLPEIGTKSYSIFEFTPVNQQKFIVDTDDGNIRIYNELTSNFLEISAPQIKDRDLISIIMELGKENKNLIYCDTKKEAIELAEQYANERNKKENDSLLEKVKKYIKDEIHEEYFLIDMLSKGVAYHIGYIPNTIRKHIENLFKSGIIDTVFCTSTLLEGVNLPADNLFMVVKDKSAIIKSDIDFKNLIGRVGRIKYNLMGNVFVLPKGSYNVVKVCSDYIKDDVKDKELSINNLLTKSQKKEIIEKLKRGDTVLEKNRYNSYDALESSRYIMNSLIDDILKEKEGVIFKQFKDLIEDDDLTIIRQNFLNKIVPQDLPITTDQIENIDEIIQNNQFTYPKDLDYNSVLRVLNIMYKIYNWGIYESKNTIGSKNNLKYYAVILQQWMLGFGINQIIKSSIKHHEENGELYDKTLRIKVAYIGDKKQKNVIINETLNTIEEIILYKLSNYFSKFSKRCMEINSIDELENDWYDYIQYGSNDKIVLKIQKHGFSREASLKIKAKKYYSIIDNEVFINNQIFKDDDELLLEEANQVRLNSYYIFK